MITNKIDKYLEESTLPSAARKNIEQVANKIDDCVEDLVDLIKIYEETKTKYPLLGTYINPQKIDIMKVALEGLKQAQRMLNKVI